MGFGADPAKRDVTREPIAEMYGQLFMEVFHAVADALGTRVVSIEPEHATTLAPHDIKIRAGTIQRGAVAATTWRWRARLDSGTEVVHAVTWTAEPALHGSKGREAAAWQIEIRGRPNVQVTIAVEDPDPAAPHMRAAVDATVAVALQSIPAVHAAPAGFYTVPAFTPYRARLRHT
jgi:2,4-diaminopentanoate dehydrogenase